MRPAIDAIARALALSGALAVVASVFLPWSERGVVALDLQVGGWELGAQPTVAVVLIALVGLPAVAGFVVGAAWPRVLAAGGVAAVVLWWLADGEAATLEAGVWTALGGSVALLLSAGSAPTGRRRPDAPRTLDRA